MTSRFVFFLALLFAASPARAVDAPAASPITRLVNVAANLEVTVTTGSTTVFKGYTDEHGKFETTPLAPGVYSFQLRIPKTIITSARYTIALSGARPLGDALIGPGVALGMNAEVRRPGPVRGHVNALRALVPVSTTTTANAATPSKVNGPVATRTMAALPSANSPTRRVTSTQPAPVRTTPSSAAVTTTRAATPTPTTSGADASRTMTARPQSGMNSTAGTSTQSAPVRATQASAPAQSTGAATPPSKVNGPGATRTMAAPPRNGISSAATAMSTPAPTVRPTPTSTLPANAEAPSHLEPRPAITQPRIIDGRRCVWVPIAGTNLGHWMPDNTGAQSTNTSRSGVPTAPSPRRAPSPSSTAKRY